MIVVAAGVTPVIAFANDFIREYADKAEVGVSVDVLPLEECPTLNEVREVFETGDEIPYKPHMLLDYGGTES